MTWVIVISSLAAIFLVFGFWPMHFQRLYGREGPETDRSVRAYDRTSRWFIFIVERISIMAALRKMAPNGVLTDVGCGPGYLAASIALKYPKTKVIGLDIDDRMLLLARKNWATQAGNLDFIAGDAQRLPFGDNTLDLMVSSLSLHHWKDAPAVFLEMQRVLKPGGKLLIWDLRRDAPHFFYYALVIGQAIFSPRSIRQINGAVGSFWASYTTTEVKAMLRKASFVEKEVIPGLGWTSARVEKPDQTHLSKAAPAVIPGPTATTRP
jgi:ubiquinone/menaquinone biosynthesis C-methylase UbiE